MGKLQFYLVVFPENICIYLRVYNKTEYTPMQYP